VTATRSLAEQLGTGLLSHRAGRHQSRRAVAAALGIAPNSLRELELGLANPTLRRVEELARKLNLRVTLTVRPAGRR
jgi:transcriptional regulator with XRE-family HTH domain